MKNWKCLTDKVPSIPQHWLWGSGIHWSKSRKHNRSKWLICIYSGFQSSNFLSSKWTFSFLNFQHSSRETTASLCCLTKCNTGMHWPDRTATPCRNPVARNMGFIFILGKRVEGKASIHVLNLQLVLHQKPGQYTAMPKGSTQVLHGSFEDAENTCYSFGLLFRMNFLQHFNSRKLFIWHH